VYFTYFIYLLTNRTERGRPDGDHFARRKLDVVHLRDEDGGHCLVQCRSVHVDCRSDWQHKPSDTLVNAEILLQAAKRYWQRSSAGHQNTVLLLKNKFDLI